MMSPVTIIFPKFPVDFKIVQCRLSNLRKGSNALSNLRVKAPHSIGLLYVGIMTCKGP